MFAVFFSFIFHLTPHMGSGQGSHIQLTNQIIYLTQGNIT
jgi:hypothetical protein